MKNFPPELLLKIFACLMNAAIVTLHRDVPCVCHTWRDVYRGCKTLQRHRCTLDPALWLLTPRKRLDAFHSTPEDHVHLESHPSYIPMATLLRRHGYNGEEGAHSWVQLFGDYVIQFIENCVIAVYKHPAKLEFCTSFTVPRVASEAKAPTFRRRRVDIAHNRIFVCADTTRPIYVYTFHGELAATIPAEPQGWDKICVFFVTKSRVVVKTIIDGVGYVYVTTLDGTILGRANFYNPWNLSMYSDIVADHHNGEYVDMTMKWTDGSIGGRTKPTHTRWVKHEFLIDNYRIAIGRRRTGTLSTIFAHEIGQPEPTSKIFCEDDIIGITQAGSFLLVQYEHANEIWVYRLRPRHQHVPHAKVILDPTTGQRVLVQEDAFDDASSMELEVEGVVPMEESTTWSTYSAVIASERFATITSDGALWCIPDAVKNVTLHRLFRGTQS